MKTLGVKLLATRQHKRPQRQGNARTGCAQTVQFQTGPAQIAHHARGQGRTGGYTEGCVFGLFLAAKDADVQAGFVVNPLTEGRAVGGLAHGGGGGRQDLVRLDTLDNSSKAFQGRHGHFDARLIQLAGDRDIAAQTGQNLFVEHGPDGAAFQPVQHKAHRVGADIDDGNLL